MPNYTEANAIDFAPGLPEAVAAPMTNEQRHRLYHTINSATGAPTFAHALFKTTFLNLSYLTFGNYIWGQNLTNNWRAAIVGSGIVGYIALRATYLSLEKVWIDRNSPILSKAEHHANFFEVADEFLVTAISIAIGTSLTGESYYQPILATATGQTLILGADKLCQRTLRFFQDVIAHQENDRQMYEIRA